MPHLSVHVQVRVMVPRQFAGGPESENVTVGFGSQLSVQEALPVLLGSVDALHLIVTSGGQVMAGGWLSVTVMT